MDDASLQNLAGAIEDPWRDLEPTVGLKQGSLARDREVALVGWVRGQREVGAGRSFSSHSGWEKLCAINARIKEQRTKPCNVDDFVQSHPDAGVHDAVQSELLARAREAEKAQESSPPAQQLEAAEGVGAEIG